MAHVLHTLQKPQCARHCLIGNLGADQNRWIALSRAETVEIYRFETPLLVPSTAIEVGGPVLALQLIPSHDRNHELLAVLVASQVLILDCSQERKLVYTIDSKVVEAHQHVETPQVLFKEADGKGCLVIHLHLGFVTVVDLSEFYKTKRGRDFRASRTFSIGNVTVKQLAMLETSKPMFAALYRDFEFRHSLRYYTLDPTLRSCAVESQFDEFKEAPLLLFTTPHGAVVVSDLNIFFFPNPGQKVLLNLQSPDVTSARNVVTLSLQTYLGSRFQAAARIDADRYLLTTDSGRTAILYLRISAPMNLVVEAFRLLELGKSTIATSLVRVQDNVFFAASRLSRSILFRVLPDSPHIHVLAYMPSSPPVLSIDYKQSSYTPELLVCQGGFHSGEFRRLAPKDFSVGETVGTSLRSGDISSMIVCHSDTEEVQFLFYDSSSTFTESVHFSSKRLTITSSTDLPNTSLTRKVACARKTEGSILTLASPEAQFGTILENGTKVFLTEKKLIYGDAEFVLPLSLQTSSFHALENSRDVLVTLWNGEIYWVRFEKKKSTLVLKRTICESEKGVISGGLSCEGLSNEMKRIVVVDTEGTITQLICSDAGEVFAESTLASKLSLPLRLLFLPEHTILYSERQLFSLSQATGQFLKLSELVRMDKPILGCELVKTQTGTFVAVLQSDGRFETIQLLKEERESNAITKSPKEEETFFSNKLLLKSMHVPNTDYSVVIEVEFKMNPNGRAERLYSLNLMDEAKLTKIHSYADRVSLLGYVDLCMLAEDDDLGIERHHFVVVTNSKKSTELLPIFRIHKGKIKKVADVSVEGSVPRDISVNRVIFANETLHIVGDSHICVQLSLHADKLEWAVVDTPTCNFALFGIDAAYLEGKLNAVLLADACRGICIISNGTTQELALPQVPSFVSSIAAGEVRGVPIVVYGDSAGNLGGVELKQSSEGRFYAEQTFACNVGDQINVIRLVKDPPQVVVGTAGGGVFCLTFEEEWSEDLLKVYEEKVVLFSAHKLERRKKGGYRRTNLYHPIQGWQKIGDVIAQDPFCVFDSEILTRLDPRSSKEATLLVETSSEVSKLLNKVDRW